MRFFASRRNYDVVAGLDARGQRRCGVLEQSWRVGGASPAELVALAAFLQGIGFNAFIAGLNHLLTGIGLTSFQWPEDAPTSAFSLFNADQVDGYAPEPGPVLPESERLAAAEAFIAALSSDGAGADQAAKK